MAAGQERQKCSICMDSFKSPKLIPCHHSFCYKCLEDYVRANLRNGRFDCPFCRKSAVLPKEGVSGFQTYCYVDDNSEETFTCDLCGPKSIACGRCLDCEENLCQSCCHAHEKSKASKHHKISNLGTLDPEMKGKIQHRIFCDEHEKEIELVCQTCNMLICYLCKAVNHENHASKTVATVATEVKKKLEVTLDKCNERLKRLNVIAQKGQEFNREITDEKKKAVSAIEQHRLKVLEAFNKEVSKMKGRVERFYLAEENERFLSDVEKEAKLCSFDKEHVTKLLNQGTFTEIIKNGPDLEKRLSEASAREDPNYETKLNKPLFEPAAVTSEELASLIGTIQDRNFGRNCKGQDPDASITQEHMNYARLCIALVTVCGNALRDMLLSYVPAPYTSIYKAILANKSTLTSKRQNRPALLNYDQSQVVFSDPLGRYVAALDQLDITLLYTLIRNVSTVPAPSMIGWGFDPPDQPRDTSLGASVERIRLYRNLISGLSVQGKISQHDFEDYWHQIEAVIHDIETVIGGQVYSVELGKQRRLVISIYEAC